MFSRKFNTYLLVIIVLFFSLDVSGQFSQSQLSNLFDERGETYFKFANSNTKVLQQLNKVISIDKVTDKEVFAYANKSEFAEFLEFEIE